MNTALGRAKAFAARFGLRTPVLLAPMAGASAPSLSVAVANAGGLGACGVLLMQPDEIKIWACDVRAERDGTENRHEDPEWNACPCCGGRMIIIETFEPGSQPRQWPTPLIGLDSS